MNRSSVIRHWASALASLGTVIPATITANAFADAPTYVLGVPSAPTIYISTDAADNEWLATNNAYAAMAIAATTGGVSRVVDIDSPQLQLASAEAGFPLERAKPDYYLADTIEPPGDVDWAATYTAFRALPEEERARFIFDDEGHRLFAAQGGTVNFTWLLTDGTERQMTYTVSLSCSGRPRRIYWTDYPYNSPSINLAGKFVKFFGNDAILTLRYGSVTNSAAGMDQVITNRVISGLYIDQSTQMLYAYGQLQGQVVMAYYDTGTFDRLLHVQVVEVCRPQVNRLTGEIGRNLKPDGRGYDISGLRARPTYVDPSDNRGDYYYQHQGQYSYSPKHNYVYPLRPTIECPWKMEVYWMETDEMEVDWPFELDQYACDWPDDATVFVRGNTGLDGGRPIYVPQEYSAELMKYQEPEGHARAVTGDGTFSTLGEGWSLLKLTTDDNIWFVPVHSILRTNTDYFTLVPEDIRVGRELRLRGGSVAGLAEGFAPKCDTDSPGYIYEALSDPIWNPNLYEAAKPDGAASVSTDGSVDISDTNRYESVVYAVRPGTLEVWWNTTIQETGMEKPLTVPTLPQVYSVRWPNPGETPQIVIASQLGSAGESVFSHNTGIYLADTNATASLPARRYFDENDGGTLMFWAKAESPDAGGRAVLTIGNSTPVAEAVDVSNNTVTITNASDWSAFAARVNNGETSLNARMVADVTLGSDAPRVGMTDENSYRGDFNGGGHVLTVDWTTDDAVDKAPVAPFPYVKGCTIHDLRVAGSLTGNHLEMGGIIGKVRSPGATISRCVVSATISSTRNGDANVGGFVGTSYWESMSVRMYDCLFDGSLLGGSATRCAGFFGWKYADPTVAFYRCLFSPSAITMPSDGAYTFIRAYQNSYNSSSIYYTVPFGTAQGTDASAMTAAELVAALGENWTLSGDKPMLASIANAPYSGQSYLSVDFPRSDNQSTISLICGGDVLSAPFPADGGWHHAAISLSPSNLVLSVDGKPSDTLDGLTVWSGLLEESVDGCLGAATINGTEILARSETTLGEVLLWNKALSADEIRTEMYKVHTGRENHLTGCFTFIDQQDLNVTGTDYRTFTDKVLGTVCRTYKCLREENGPLAKGTGLIETDEEKAPKVYVQNAPEKTGYNPNEEHAVVMSGSGGYVAWALRSDLNSESSSAAGVLVEYVKDGRRAMQWFDVVTTNSVYPELAGDCVAGKAFPGPHPIDFFDDPWCLDDSWDEPVTTAPAFRDRKGQLWARAAGTATMHMYYRMQEGFAFPALDRANWPAIGAPVPWLSLLGESPTASTVLSQKPHPWVWRVTWPEDVPEIEIGRTITAAASGLPEVWNGKSVGVVWPATEAARDATAVLFDPTVAQTSGFPKTTYNTVADAIADLGIKQGAGGNGTLRRGRWTFDGLPPSISKRFYLDTTADVTQCLKLEGEMEDNAAGASLLHVNILNESERETLSALLDKTASSSGKKAWRTAIAALATACVKPSPHQVVSDTEDRINYSPRDHYALFTMGATNYVTLIENDTTNALMNVAAGDPISMHLIKVIPTYYTGRVVTREDPLNLLSQQLSVIYGEAFAGGPEQYVFEWKKCQPHADGSVPKDFDAEYTAKFEPTAGLTRFVIGGQGDTLANMVNTYYAVRYRAANENSPAYATMGDAWSEWTDPPALAEGWVQRVLNNVTPFAQRMRDLVDNEAETPVSMIRQAGAPYEGDIALNQDNLTSVGLIQLYETILSKAESMSLQMGIDNADANKQLQLAVARLADLYNTLGDEAYIDALNPTIGFGSNFDNTEMTGFELDYGALSSTLFAFDNQVPTLLDEELALLRGRSGDNAPSTHISPYYNRLVWNFTKGITAGEVAYAVNYDISGNNKGIIDENDAADMYPQGHGDAYGHYLSALSGYYRLLRNPHFTWGAPAMGEMVVADAVVNVDYYDEAQFAKAAYNVAKVAAETVDRTARKAYRDNGGATGAGYLDSDGTRNFGYGEWASRGGFGALCNWAVGNALLPAEPKGGYYWRYRFSDGNDAIWTELDEDDPIQLSQNGPWTVEFQIVPAEPGASSQSESQRTSLVTLDSFSKRLAFDRDPSSGMVSAALYALAPVTNSVQCGYYFYTNSVDWINVSEEDFSEVSMRIGTNVYICVFIGSGAPTVFPEGYEPASLEDFEANPPQFDGWGCMSTIEYVDDNTNEVSSYPCMIVYDDAEIDYVVGAGEPEATVEVGIAAAEMNTLVALRRTAEGSAEALLITPAGAVTASATLTDDFSIDLAGGVITLGGDGYTGEIGEFRIWDDVARPNADLHAKRDFVSPLADGLALYLRPITDNTAVATAHSSSQLSDEANDTCRWTVEGGEWIAERESGMNIAFEDEGLNRIDRSTVPELASIASLIPDIQKKVDQMDAGLNPLGLATSAIPFDITPIGEGDDSKTHFEQIRERAGTALANARKLLDKAQTMGSHMRMMQESQFSRENQLETMELETKNRLIEYFGYPYEGDIGPGGTYPQGYDGPDLFNYAWMEPTAYGFKADEDVKSITTNLYIRDVSKFRDKLAILLPNFGKTEDYMTLTYEKSASGIILKPANITGKRRACGQIQDKLGEFLIAYRDYKNALSAWERANVNFEYQIGVIRRSEVFYELGNAISKAKYIYETYSSFWEAKLKMTINGLEQILASGQETIDHVVNSTPQIVGAGMTVNTDPSAFVAAALYPAEATLDASLRGTLLGAKNVLVGFDEIGTGFDIAEELHALLVDYMETYDEYYATAMDAADDVRDAAKECRNAYAELLAAEAAVETVVAEAERIIDERTLARQQATDALTKTRYNEMFFRLARNNALSRYSAQFELAQKYAYLAAQAYDYETGLLSADRASGERFMARIVGTRTLGEFDDDGEPIAASDAAKGDGGLAAILAELDANWLVLKPRLGINNPQPYATWFSFRHDLFRIYDEEDGDKAWKTELRKYVVNDLSTIPEFRHYCQPLAGSTAEKEPGLVIPFSSVIAHGYNFFGEPLAGGDAALDATYYATHISSAGVHFEGFDDGVLSRTPTVYLVPVGEDRMRAVGDPDTVLSWRVVDQTIPAPYAIGSTQLDDPDWTPLFDGNTGGNDLGTRIRKHPSFRAYYDDEGKEPSDDSLDCTRLVGRSAWNTKWLLIIPAGSLGADREAALSAFVNGIDSNRDGTLDFKGVSDIKIGLKTYSTSGN